MDSRVTFTVIQLFGLWVTVVVPVHLLLLLIVPAIWLRVVILDLSVSVALIVTDALTRALRHWRSSTVLPLKLLELPTASAVLVPDQSV